MMPIPGKISISFLFLWLLSINDVVLGLLCAMIAAVLNIYCAGQRLPNVATSGSRRLWFFIMG